MVQIRGLFETHLTVSDLERAIEFYRDVLQLPLAHRVPDRGVAFFWIGAPGKAMLGLWETGSGPQRMSLHLAFEVAVEDVLTSPAVLSQAGIALLDFDGQPATGPIVLSWMPAVATYFRDPDGNLLEFLAMLPEPPQPELGVVAWSAWAEVRP